MNRGEVRDYVQFLIDDKDGAIISSSDINTLINISIDKVAGHIRKLKSDYFVKTGVLPTVSNTRSYLFTAITTDVDKVRMIEKNTSPAYMKLHRLDWLKHKLESSATGEPEHYYIINNTIYFLPVPNAVYSYTVYYEQAVTYPTGDTTTIPLIPVKYHDVVGINAALLAKQHVSHYQKQAANMDYIMALMADRIKDMTEDMAGNRNEDVELATGVLGDEVK